MAISSSLYLFDVGLANDLSPAGDIPFYLHSELFRGIGDRGVSDRRESLRFFRDKNLEDRSGHSFVPGWGREDSIAIECFPLSEILTNHGLSGCDVLKIDVEGFEFRVLKPFLEQCRPRLVLTEYFESRNTGDVRLLLKSNGYRLERQIGRDYLFSLNESRK